MRGIAKHIHNMMVWIYKMTKSSRRIVAEVVICVKCGLQSSTFSCSLSYEGKNTVRRQHFIVKERFTPYCTRG